MWSSSSPLVVQASRPAVADVSNCDCRTVLRSPPPTPVCSAQPPPAPLPRPGAQRLGRALLPHPILRPPAHPGPPTPWPAGETPTCARTVSCSEKPDPTSIAPPRDELPRSGKPAGRTFHGVFPSPVVAPPQGAASRRSRRRAHLLTWNLAEFLTSTGQRAHASGGISQAVFPRPRRPTGDLVTVWI